MATIHRRVTRAGHVRYRAQIRIKNQPPISATFRKRSEATKWARETESAQITGVYSPLQAPLRFSYENTYVYPRYTAGGAVFKRTGNTTTA